jgi:hypothetical protein
MLPPAAKNEESNEFGKTDKSDLNESDLPMTFF